MLYAFLQLTGEKGLRREMDGEVEEENLLPVLPFSLFSPFAGFCLQSQGGRC
jgi:hypothetical protein